MYDQTFFDTRIAHFYETEETTASLVKAFAGLAILISCIGLYGLVAFLAVQKMKEVGIRKVLGASVGYKALRAASVNPVDAMRSE